jgi:hypothetical protein
MSLAVEQERDTPAKRKKRKGKGRRMKNENFRVCSTFFSWEPLSIRLCKRDLAPASLRGRSFGSDAVSSMQSGLPLVKNFRSELVSQPTTEVSASLSRLQNCPILSLSLGAARWSSVWSSSYNELETRSTVLSQSERRVENENLNSETGPGPPTREKVGRA